MSADPRIYRDTDDSGGGDGETDPTAATSSRRLDVLAFFSAAFGPRAHVAPLIARLFLAALFIIAGALKIGHPDDLAATITDFALGLPALVVAVLAVALPLLEILLGIYLAVGWFLPATSAAACALLIAFIVVLASVVARGIHTSCGCFGPADSSFATWWTVGRDALFALPAVYLAWWSRADRRL
jgi:putative oxidoreductase